MLSKNGRTKFPLRITHIKGLALPPLVVIPEFSSRAGAMLNVRDGRNRAG